MGQLGEKFQELDMNVEPAWLQGLTGEGVTVGVVDDGEGRILSCDLAK